MTRDYAFAKEDRRNRDGRRAARTKPQPMILRRPPRQPTVEEELEADLEQPTSPISLPYRSSHRPQGPVPGWVESTQPPLANHAPRIQHNSAPKEPNMPAVSIAMISAVAFHHNLKRKENTLFTASLYKIDQILKEKQGPTKETTESEEELITKMLPKVYAEFKDVFSKAASEELPPHRPYDHKIKIEGENTIGYSLLRHQSVDELLATKKFLI